MPACFPVEVSPMGLCLGTLGMAGGVLSWDELLDRQQAQSHYRGAGACPGIAPTYLVPTLFFPPSILAQAQEFEEQKLSKFHFLILVLRPENMGTQPGCRGWGTKEVKDEIRDKRATTQSHWISWVTAGGH